MVVDNSVENVDNLGRTKKRTQNNGSQGVIKGYFIKHSVILNGINHACAGKIITKRSQGRRIYCGTLHGFYKDFAVV